MPVLENDLIRVEIAEEGAELRSIRTGPDKCEWLWHGDPAWWSGRAPLLFPVVGQSPQGQVTIAGQSFPMKPHGFARNSRFRVVSTDAHRAEMELLADDDTRASFPFSFRLSISFELDGCGLRCLARVANLGADPMPFQFGYHPAFCWPLPGAAGAPHRLIFEDGQPLRMVHPGPDGLLIDDQHPVPAEAGVIELDPRLFANGALVFPEAAGRAFTYEGGEARMRMTTAGLPNFALWQKMGAPFLCLEPWQGMAPFPAQGAAIETRNYSLNLLPQEERQFAMNLAFHAAGG
ncbi:aldose 1-epimerase family protein [Paracoccus sp. MBLB3053]|uniref:Aldose 1-epimerase family protein n=1 Tax=Paracoccus aurantius TaxID=3073814 RepID=A0ABU2HWU0_9RHOB|nr:aldose 1-epimerase family protein [Paracoccus sp. MBLB3053]MDS9469217.1 aldose 1-epimerase family protein [Paracoccus sp. MBLB3053]